MPGVVVNSTPIIILCSINRLDILKSLYGKVIIPKAVFREVTFKDDAVSEQLERAADWICIKEIKDNSEKKMYKAKLHDGEVEVMILSKEENADLLIIDDNAAKKTAKYLGFAVTGTLGVILRAKQQKIISEAEPLISEMEGKGFYISETVKNMVLRQAGEL